jgi:hypothetical protein
VGSFVFGSDAPSVGASGAIFGLFGLLLVANRVHRPALGRPARALVSQLGMLVVLNLFLGFSLPFIDNMAHIGGLLAGAWLGFVLVPRTATLSSFWYRPQGTGGRGAGSTRAGERGAGERGPQLLLRGAAVVALLAVIVLGVVLGSPRWE